MLLAHAVHLDDEEVAVVLDRHVGIAYCPWAYLRLGQGVARAGRHAEIVAAGGRVALGCDAENAGDHVDVLRAAAAAAGIALDAGREPFGAHTALELATIRGAEAIGMGHEIGSLEPGKRADVVLVDTTAPNWVPRSPDPVLQLVWASDGRDVRHVVASGRIVVRDGRCTTVDVGALADEAQSRQRRLLATAGLDPRPGLGSVRLARGLAGHVIPDGKDRQASSALGTAAWQPRVPSTTCVTPTSTATDASE